MSDFWLSATLWVGRSVLAGGTALLLGWFVVRLVVAPELKQRIASWTIRAAVLAPLLCLFPAWLTVAVPVSARGETARSHPVSIPEPRSGETIWQNEDARSGLADSIVEDGFTPISSDESTTPTDLISIESESIDPVPDSVDVTVSSSAAPTVVNPTSLIDAIAPLVLIPYAMVFTGLLAHLLAGHVGLVRLRGSAVPAPVRVLELLDRLTADWRWAPVVLMSDRLASPVCFGLLRPTILLPRSLATAANDSQLRWVLAHELEHLRRGDPLTGWWLGVARAVFFFLPWYWPLRKELALAQEYLADAAAADADGRALDYAAFLVDLSGDKSRLPLAAFAVRAGSSDLFRRVTMLLSARAGIHRPTRGWAVLAVGGVLAATVLISGVGLAADDDKPKPKKVIVVQVDDDAKADAQGEKRVIKVRPDGEKPQTGDKKPVRDGDKPKPAPRDGDKPKVITPDGRRFELRAINAEEIAELKKAIIQAAQKGNEDDVKKLVDQLEKVLTASAMRVFGPEGFKVPPIPPIPPIPRIDGAQIERAHRDMERAQRAFAEAIEKLKDNPEAKEALQKAQAEYKKAMELAGEKLKGQFKDFEKLKDLEKLREFRGDARAFAFGKEAGQPRFGVAAATISDELAEQLDLPKGRGVVVQSVVAGSTAEKAGLHKNDIILQFAGQSVSGENFADVVARTKSGEKVDIVILRKGKRETLKGIELPQQKKPETRRVEVRPASGLKLRVPEGEAGTGAKARFEKMSVSVNDDSFEIDAARDDLRYRLSGTLSGGKANPESITITEGKKKTEYKSVDDVPEAHRAAVRQLLGNVGGGR